jgi:hypothetical protein
MPATETGTKVFIDGVVLAAVDKSKPAAMSRTAWVNYLLQQGMTSIKKLENKKND